MARASLLDIKYNTNNQRFWLFQKYQNLTIFMKEPVKY